jgi:hypothetical protein
MHRDKSPSRSLIKKTFQKSAAGLGEQESGRVIKALSKGSIIELQ